jgi:hypothetical protein
MPPCAAADELHGLNHETAELNASTLSTTVFDRRNASCPRRQNLARLGGDELLRPQCAAEATGLPSNIVRLVLTGHQGYNARVQRPPADALK